MRLKAFAFLAFFTLPAAAQPFPDEAGPYPMLPPFPGERPQFCPYSDQAFARQAETLITDGINAERAQFAPEAPMLAPDPDLTRIARIRSCDMAHGGDFSHTDEQGNFIAGDMVEARFGRYGATGENIMKMGEERRAQRVSRSGGPARATNAASLGERPDDRPPFGPEEFARVAVEGWMKSPGHRENILNPRYNLSGIGVAMVDGQAFATQVFRGPPRVRKSGK